MGSNRWVLIDSATLTPRDIETPEALLESVAKQPSSASADLPELLQVAHDYIKENRTGQTEVWMLSDLRENDWNAGSGAWRSLRESFGEFKQGVRFHLLAYPQQSEANYGIRVTSARREKTDSEAKLVVSLALTASTDGKHQVPVQFDLEGARTEEKFEWQGLEHIVKEHVIPLDTDTERGWGRVRGTQRHVPG